MDLRLSRREYCPDGIFSDLQDDQFKLSLSTLEHAYAQPAGSPRLWLPKIPPGIWTCERGMHKLHGMVDPFETFEVMGVPGHAGLLVHWGNYNQNSEGCILTGLHRVKNMVTDSRAAFARFMLAQQGCDRFQLRVTE